MASTAARPRRPNGVGAVATPPAGNTMMVVPSPSARIASSRVRRFVSCAARVSRKSIGSENGRNSGTFMSSMLMSTLKGRPRSSAIVIAAMPSRIPKGWLATRTIGRSEASAGGHARATISSSTPIRPSMGRMIALPPGHRLGAPLVVERGEVVAARELLEQTHEPALQRRIVGVGVGKLRKAHARCSRGEVDGDLYIATGAPEDQNVRVVCSRPDLRIGGSSPTRASPYRGRHSSND